MYGNYEVDLVNGLKKIYGVHLKQIILYGSVARNTEEKDSDIDVAIIVDNMFKDEVKGELIDFAVELDFKYDKVFSIVDIEYCKFKEWEDVLPFYKNVKKDGIMLWKAA